MKSRNSRRQSIASRHSQGRSGTYLRQASPPLRGHSPDDIGIPHTYHDYNDVYATSHHNYDPSEDGISHHNYDPHRRADDEDSSDHDDDDDSDSSSSNSSSDSDHDYAQGEKDTRHLVTNPHTLQLTQPREYTVTQGHMHHPQLSTLEEENEDDLSSSRGPGTPITLGRSFSSGASLTTSAPPPVSLSPPTPTPTSPLPRTLPRLFDVVEEVQSHADYSPTTPSTVNNPLIPDFTKKRSRYFIPTALESISEKHDLKLNHHEDDHDHEEAAFGISAVGATAGVVGATTAGVAVDSSEVKRGEDDDDTPFALLTKSALKNSRLRLAEDDNNSNTNNTGTSVGGMGGNTSPHTPAKPYRFIGPEDLPTLATNKNKVNFKDSPRPPLANNTTPSLPPLTLSTNNTVPKPKYYAPQPTGNKSAAFQSRFTQARMAHDRHSDAGSRAHSHRHGAGTTGAGHMRQSRMTARSRVSHSSSLYNGAKAL